MSDYFKFCPKCGRVLYGDFCAHCEPEKERAYRRKQQKLDDSMFEDYSKKRGLGKGFSKRETKSFDWNESETKHTDWNQEEKGSDWTRANKEYSKWDSNGKKQTQRKKQREKNGEQPGKVVGSIIVVVLALISFGMDILKDVDIDWKDPVSSFVKEIKSDFDATETVQDHSFFDEFSGQSNDNGDTIDMEYEDEDYIYYMGDEECGYDAIPRFYLYDDENNVIDCKVQKKWDALYEEYKKDAIAMKNAGKEKAKASVEGYVTYLDDDYANLIVEYYKDHLDTGKVERKIQSYVINMTTMEEVSLDEFLDTDEISIASYLEDAGLGEKEAEQKAKDGDYYLAIGEDGNIWVGTIVKDGDEQIIEQTYTESYVN